MDQYLVASDFLKNIVENGNTLDDQTYSSLCSLLQDDAHVIEAFELAKSGTVSQVYPLEGNEEAIGLDMLTHPERKKEAQLAKETGQYTIAGPLNWCREAPEYCFLIRYTQKLQMGTNNSGDFRSWF